MKATINSNFGIKNCADCENNIRCEQCVYNKKSIEEVYKEIRKETAKEILNMGKKLYEMSYHKSNAMPRLIEWIKVEYGLKEEE